MIDPFNTGCLSDILIIDELIGNSYRVENDGYSLKFISTEGKKSYIFYHIQDCCESVDIDGVDGDLTILENSPIIRAYSVTGVDYPQKDKYDDSFTWTFYRFATEKGEVTVRFYGTSNGYYSESVSMMEIK